MGKLPIIPIRRYFADLLGKEPETIMAANPQLDGTVFTSSRLRTCMADLSHTIDHLQAIEAEMADIVQEMLYQGDSRERILIVNEMLADLRSALNELGYVHR